MKAMSKSIIVIEVESEHFTNIADVVEEALRDCWVREARPYRIHYGLGLAHRVVMNAWNSRT